MRKTEAYKLIKDNDHVRMPASPEEAKCAEYLKNACEKLGLSAKIEPFIIPTFREKAAYLCVDGKEVPCRGRLGSPNASAKGPLYYLQSNSKVALRKCKGTGRFPVCSTRARAVFMPMYAELLLGLVARYTVASAKGIRPSGQPIFITASKAALAMSSALGLAKPISSEADITKRRAMNEGSSPPCIMRASQ